MVGTFPVGLWEDRLCRYSGLAYGVEWCCVVRAWYASVRNGMERYGSGYKIKSEQRVADSLVALVTWHGTG